MPCIIMDLPIFQNVLNFAFFDVTMMLKALSSCIIYLFLFSAGTYHDLGIRNHLIKNDQLSSSFSNANKEYARLNSPYPGLAPMASDLAGLPSFDKGTFNPDSWPLYFDINFGHKTKVNRFVLEKSRLSSSIEIKRFTLSHRANTANGWQLFYPYPFLEPQVSNRKYL